MGSEMMKWGKDDWRPIHPFRQGDAVGDAEQADLLGGKGANLAEMCNLGLPVPAGFTIDTEACARFQAHPSKTLRYLKFRIQKAYSLLAKDCGFAPLVSVRSGAKFSMPGMMDTISNLGLTSASINFWRTRLGEEAAEDCYRRFIREYGKIVHGVKFPKDTGQDPVFLKQHFELETKTVFPDDVMLQLRGAVAAVFASWNNERAVEYRNLNNLPHDLGTAVNIQRMVFGNTGEESGTGVLFTRDPSTGEKKVMGEFLPNAQGEDLVAGTSTPMKLEEMSEYGLGECYAELMEHARKLEDWYNDMQDIEFTVEKKKLYILQTRSGKRTAHAAFRIATDQVKEGSWTKKHALTKLTTKQYFAMNRVEVSPKFKTEPNGIGLPASPGFATGIVVRSNEEALAATEPCILVRPETDPDDLPGMNAAVGILTETGGVTSHAAVVARGMNTPCVTGLQMITYPKKDFGDGAPSKLPSGSKITIDGSTGRVWVGTEVPTVSGAENPCVKRAVEWCYEETGAMREGDSLESDEQVVRVMSWLSNQDAMVSTLAKLAKLPIGKRSKVVLDFRPRTFERRDEDKILWDAFGDSGEEKVSKIEKASTLLDALATAKLKGTTVVLDHDQGAWVKVMEDSGYRVGRTATRVADLLEPTGPVDVPKDFITNVIGGQKAYTKFLQVLKKSGVAIDPVPQGMSEEEVVSVAFGGE